MIPSLPYRYHHLPIGGGGYVTGFYFHPSDPDILYCRTDIGGVYRFDYSAQQWLSLMDHVSWQDLRETCPISAALDESRPERIYIVSGLWDPESKGLLTLSDDRGEHFSAHELPVYAHGNLHGRSAGERLWAEGDQLYLASQSDGLWRSYDAGASWEKISSFPETACTFVIKKGNLLLVGTEGIALRKGDQRGHSLYASLDGGHSFFPLPQPEYEYAEGSKLHGLVAQRCAFDENYLYVSFSANGPYSQNIQRGYACDCGDCSAGRLARYPLTPEGIGPMEDITPEKGRWGYSAVDARHGLLITATAHRMDGDAIYLSSDQGKSWRKILHRLEVGRMDFRLPYMQPKNNGGGNLVHWMTDVKIDPHRPGTAWFNTGTGVFRTENLTGDPVIWQDWCDGLEETVHIGVYAPPGGRVQVIDIVGDLGGFAFTDVKKHCENTFADAENNRWITCLNADWPDDQPDHILVTARGNWTGKTKGGLIQSLDGAKSWRRLPTPLGCGEDMDELLQKIEQPNTNAGWAAVSADGNTYLWAVAQRVMLYARNLLVSHDKGQHFHRARVLDQEGLPAQGMMKPIADRCLPRIFYGFGDQGELFVSTDSGDTFREKQPPEGFPKGNFGLVDCADQTEIRATSGQPGDLYIATGEGLWKLHYDEAADCFSGRRLTKPGDRAFCIGLGLGRPGGEYAKEPKALYFNGILGGAYGFYRTLDEGKTYQRLNHEKQMYGRIHSIDGDKRIFGRFYLATGSSGLLYGEREET